MRDPLYNLFRLNEKIVLVGVGETTRGDDGIGIYICQNVKKSEHIKSIEVGMNPLDYVDQIKALEPEHIVFIDAVDFDRIPGFFDLLTVNHLKDHTSHEHNLCFDTLAKQFEQPVYVLGIQPKNRDIGTKLSNEVKMVSIDIIEMINKWVVVDVDVDR